MVLEPTKKDDADPQHKMAKMVRLITKLGPDINLIARMTGAYKETVRYWYMKKLLAKGMVVQAVPNEAALGLKRVVAKVRVAELFLPHIQQTFSAMNDISYASNFGMSVPEGFYTLCATVPVQYIDDYSAFILKLKDMGIFESVELFEFDWFRRPPMRAEYYDFDSGRWDYDWKKSISPDREEIVTKESQRARFDKTDLLIIKELQLDATRSLTQIGQALQTKNKLELDYKTISWHYRKHVVRNGLINNYSIRWIGTRYNQETEKTEQKQHKYMATELIIKGVSSKELLDLTAKLHQTPFIWSEMGGKDYLAQCVFPIESMVEAYDYLYEVMCPYVGRASFHVVDQKNSLQFVLPYNLWSAVDKEWTFDLEGLLARFENLVLKIKS